MKKRILPLLLCVTLALGGCGNLSTMKESADTIQTEESQSNGYGSANYNITGDVDRGEIDEESSDLADHGMAESPEAPAEESESASSGNNNSTTETGDSTSETNTKKKQKLVYSCDMTIESLEYDKTVTSVKEQIRKYDGIIEEENENDNNPYWYDSSKNGSRRHAYLTIRIPAEKYEAFLEDLSGDGKVTNKSMQVENITRHYSEVETTIKSLKTQEKRLLEMMEKSSTVEDMITVESRLTEVQNELAQYKNALASLDTDVSYSTIRLSIDEVVRYDAPKNTFTERLISTLEDSKEFFLSFMENGLFFLIMALPVFLVIALFLWIVISILKAIRRRSKMRKSKKKILGQKMVAENTEEKVTEKATSERYKVEKEQKDSDQENI